MAVPDAPSESDPSKWPRYFAATADKPVHPIFDSLEVFLPPSGVAIDLGCGAGRGTLWLLERGFRTVAVDIAEEAIDYVKERVPDKADVELVCSSFQDLDLPVEAYDVAVACFTLFFLPPHDFNIFWDRVVASVKSGGLFAGQFLGVNDSWSDRGYTMLDRAGVESRLEGLKVLKLDEEEQDGQTSLGESKHWHVFHVIARKP